MCSCLHAKQVCIESAAFVDAPGLWLAGALCDAYFVVIRKMGIGIHLKAHAKAAPHVGSIRQGLKDLIEAAPTIHVLSPGFLSVFSPTRIVLSKKEVHHANERHQGRRGPAPISMSQ